MIGRIWAVRFQAIESQLLCSLIFNKVYNPHSMLCLIIGLIDMSNRYSDWFRQAEEILEYCRHQIDRP